jgi:N-acetylmuramoyl-L-alanine amidase
LKIIRKINTAILITFLFFSLNVFCQSNRKFVIVIDAGHGGKDPGNSHHGLVEKKIVLKTALKIEKYLERDEGIRVIHTRKKDVFIKLKDRPNIANSAHADLFISIHCNAVKHLDSYGTESFVMGLSRSDTNMEVAKNENSVILLEEGYKQRYKGFDAKKPETLVGFKMMQEEYLNRSVYLASKIESNFKNRLNRKSRGIKQTPLWVLDAAFMPSVLVELGFLSNNKEGIYLNSDKGQEKMAKAIADAIIAYKKVYSGNGSIKSDSQHASDENKRPLAASKKGVIYKVKIATGDKKMELKSFNFKGLKNVSVKAIGENFYEYLYESTSDYKTAKKNLEVAKSKGYSSAYLLAYKDGKKISIKEALKL